MTGAWDCAPWECAQALLRFYRSAYRAGATAAGWDRGALEHPGRIADGG